MKRIIVLIMLSLISVSADDFNVITSMEGDKSICEKVSTKLDQIVEYKKTDEKYINFDTFEDYYKRLHGKEVDGSMYKDECPNWFENYRDMENRFASVRFTDIDVNGTKKTLLWTDPAGRSVQGKIALVDLDTCSYEVLAQRYNYKRAYPPWGLYTLVSVDKSFYLQNLTTYTNVQFIDLYELNLDSKIINLDSSKKRCVIKLEKLKREK